MSNIYIICFAVFVLMSIAIFLFLGLGNELSTSAKATARIRRKQKAYKTRSKASRSFNAFLKKQQSVIDQSPLPKPLYAVLTICSGATGYLAGKVVFNSTLLSVIVGVLSLLLPMIVLGFRQNKNKSKRLDRLASSMMILSNSYLVTEDFITTVKDNLALLEFPEPFKDFLTYATMMDSDVRSALRRMEAHVNNVYFSQWVDALVLAQDDRSLRYVAVSVVDAMHDVLQAQEESDAAMYAVWREYIVTLVLIFSVPLVFKLLMYDAYVSMTTSLIGQSLTDELRGVIFLNPMHGYGNSTEPQYVSADEYLSGNVREKLEWAKRSAELNSEDYAVNVQALEAVQPKDLSASEISVRLGATWLPPDVIEEFIFDLFDTPRYCQWNIHVHLSKYTGEWNVEGKTYDRSNIKSNSTYGTDRINGYKIIEQTLNLKDVRIFDYVEDENGRKTPILNKKETAIAQGKQELIKQAFADWIWTEPERRERLCKLYNEKFNSVRPREYDGSHLNLVGINPEITLRPHQRSAVARGLYGGNELLGHVVGAGKTYTIVAIAQESKRLGLAQKSLIVVPNHLTEQWAADYLQLYPAANILVATAKDFEAKNRKRFCGRIATGDYDAIIIGHSQLEKIPMSVERQTYILEQESEEIMNGIAELKANRGDRFSVKQLERAKKSVQVKLDKLNDQSRKDDLVTFEELGVDRLFIDEAHYYKNLAAFTKMRNVGGISQTEAMKSSDLFMKCRYLDELTGGHGVIFATGTPISNTMVEMYTMQKYLQYRSAILITLVGDYSKQTARKTRNYSQKDMLNICR